LADRQKNILKLFSFLVILTNLFFFNIKAKSFGVACVTAKDFNDDSEKKKESKPEKLSGLSIKESPLPKSRCLQHR